MASRARLGAFPGKAPKVVTVKGAWSEEEDLRLAELQKKLGNRWSCVAAYLHGRTGQQCAQRWRHKVNPNIRKEKWTEAEDRKLAEMYDVYGQKWAEIARHLEGRTDQQCMGRWRRHLDPSIRRDVWLQSEDNRLVELQRKMGASWSAIAKELKGRTAQQCRARWFQMFDSSEKLKKEATKTVVVSASSGKGSSAMGKGAKIPQGVAQTMSAKSGSKPVREVWKPKLLTPNKTEKKSTVEAEQPARTRLLSSQRKNNKRTRSEGAQAPKELELPDDGAMGEEEAAGDARATGKGGSPPPLLFPTDSEADPSLSFDQLNAWRPSPTELGASLALHLPSPTEPCTWKTGGLASLQLPLISPTGSVPPELLSPESLSGLSPTIWATHGNGKINLTPRSTSDHSLPCSEHSPNTAEHQAKRQRVDGEQLVSPSEFEFTCDPLLGTPTGLNWMAEGKENKLEQL